MKLHITILSSVIILIGDLHITLMLQLDYTLLVSFIYKNTSHSFTKFGFKDCKKKRKKKKEQLNQGSCSPLHWYLSTGVLILQVRL